MSGRGETPAGTELEAAARRLAALADRLRALRVQLAANAGATGHAAVREQVVEAPAAGGGSAGPK